MDEGETSATRGKALVEGARCVVLVRPGTAAPNALLSADARHGGPTRVVTDPPGVMVELARMPADALIVVDPLAQPRLGDLIDAIRTYYPATLCRQYRPGHSGEPRLEPIGDPPADASRTVSREPTRAALRRTRQRVKPLTVKLAAGVGQADTSPLITEQELAMLLGPTEVDSAVAAEPEASAT